MEQMEYKKQRCTVWLTKEAVLKSDAGKIQEELPSRSDYIEKAIHFYAGYLAAAHNVDYFAMAIQESISGTVKTSENRLARLLFKIAVEMAKLEQMLATINDMDEETLRRLHIRCVNDVKKINGIIRMEDAVRFQRGEEE